MSRKHFILTSFWISLSLGLLFWVGCHKDSPLTKLSNSKIQDRSNSVLYLSFEMETTTLAKTVDGADYALLEPIDQMMALPHRERYAVEACYKSNGDKVVSMVRQTPHDPITYPENTADGYLAPPYSRLTIENGSITYYDQFDQVMGYNGVSTDATSITQIIELVTNQNTLTDAQFNQGLQLLGTNGAQLQQHANNLVSLQYDLPDGTKSIQVIDKTTRAAVGNLHYDAAGGLLTRSMLDVSGNFNAPVVNRFYMESFMTSMVGNIPMKIVQYADFENFDLVKN